MDDLKMRNDDWKSLHRMEILFDLGLCVVEA